MENKSKNNFVRYQRMMENLHNVGNTYRAKGNKHHTFNNKNNNILKKMNMEKTEVKDTFKHLELYLRTKNLIDIDPETIKSIIKVGEMLIDYVHSFSDTKTLLNDIRGFIFILKESKIGIKKIVIEWLKYWFNKYWNEDWKNNKELKENIKILIYEISKIDQKSGNIILNEFQLYNSKSNNNDNIQTKKIVISNQKLTVNELCNQLTFIIYNLYSEITKRELYNNFYLKNKSNNIINLCNLYEYFKIWIQFYILLPKSYQERGKNIETIIKMLLIFSKQNNYFCLDAIINAIKRINKKILQKDCEWEYVSKENKQLYSILKGYSNYNYLKSVLKSNLNGFIMPINTLMFEFTHLFGRNKITLNEMFNDDKLMNEYMIERIYMKPINLQETQILVYGYCKSFCINIYFSVVDIISKYLMDQEIYILNVKLFCVIKYELIIIILKKNIELFDRNKTR